MTLSVGILAFKFTLSELLTAAVQRRIYTELSPLPLVAGSHQNRFSIQTLPYFAAALTTYLQIQRFHTDFIGL